MADLIDRVYLIGKFEDTGQPAVSEMGKGFDLGIAAALRVVKSAPAVNRWIPCSERLPEEDGEYIVTVLDKNGRGVFDAWYWKKKNPLSPQSEGWHLLNEFAPFDDIMRDKIIAWMPRPDAYDPESEVR